MSYVTIAYVDLYPFIYMSMLALSSCKPFRIRLHYYAVYSYFFKIQWMYFALDWNLETIMHVALVDIILLYVFNFTQPSDADCSSFEFYFSLLIFLNPSFFVVDKKCNWFYLAMFHYVIPVYMFLLLKVMDCMLFVVSLLVYFIFVTIYLLSIRLCSMLYSYFTHLSSCQCRNP